MNQSQSTSIIKISGEDVTIVSEQSSGKKVEVEVAESAPSSMSEENEAISASIEISAEDDSPTSNGAASLSEQLQSVTLSSNRVPAQPKPISARKNDLIADIQSAVGGNSSLSLRSVKSKGEGVSCVFQKSNKQNPGATTASSSSTNTTNNTSRGSDPVSTPPKPLSDQFDPKNFLDKVGKVDSSGNAIPEWRRQVLARHAAERAQREWEEQKVVDDYEARFQGMPAWKRALIERKEANEKMGYGAK